MTRAVAVRLRSMRGSLMWVGAGLSVYGFSTYGYLTFAARALGAEGFAPISTYWTLINALAIGAFAPLEQEVSRSTAHGSTAGGGNIRAVRTSLAYTTLVLGLSALGALFAADEAAHLWFAGHSVLVPLFLVAMGGQAFAYLLRGLLSGSGSLERYGLQFLVDGVLRVVGAGILLAADVSSVPAYALVLALSPVVAVLLTSPRPSTLVHRGAESAADAALSGMGVLLLASASSQLLANAGPATIAVIASPAERVATGPFLAGLVLARVPLFVFAAVQAVFLPALARAVGSGSVARYRALVRLVFASTLAVSTLGVLISAVAGPELVLLIFGSDFQVSRILMILLAVSGTGYLVALVFAQSLLALRAEAAVAAAWAAGLGTYLLSLVLPGDVSERVAAAMTVGSFISAGLMGGFLVTTVRAWRRGVEVAA